MAFPLLGKSDHAGVSFPLTSPQTQKGIHSFIL